ncbi:hypothetical protein Tco_0153396 [Tanacetum coccineum]
MDIRDEIKLSKGDMLPDSDENKHRNKLPGVKAIDRVSLIKLKSKVTGKSNSPKSRKESEKAAVVKGNSVVSKSKVAAVVSEKSTVVKESVVKSIEKLLGTGKLVGPHGSGGSSKDGDGDTSFQ